MSGRKFYAGDVVEVAGTSKYASKHSYADDLGTHRGVIKQTTITRRNSGLKSVYNYTVECECGQEIHPIATDLNLVSEPSSPKYIPINQDTRLRHFLLTIGVVEDSTKARLRKAVLEEVENNPRLTLEGITEAATARAASVLGEKAEVTNPLLEQARIILRPLKPRERYVIAMRFGIAGVLGESPFESGKLWSEYPLRRTLSDLGEELGVSRERIRQIEGRGLCRAKGDG